MLIVGAHAVSRQATEEVLAKLAAAQQAEERALEKLAMQKSALGAMETDFEARTERLQAALREAAAAKSSVDALQAEVEKGSSEAQAARKVTGFCPLGSLSPLALRFCTQAGHYGYIIAAQSC